MKSDRIGTDASLLVAAYDTLARAQEALHILERAEFPMGQVSLIARGRHDKQIGSVAIGIPGDDSVRDAAIGAGLGAILGVLTGISAATLTGIGIVFLAGPLAGLFAGATVGAVLGGLSGWGVHRHQIEHYERLVREGHVLVLATGDPRELADARRVLQETQPVELHLYSGTESESPEVAK